MAEGEITTDALGGQYRVFEGQEQAAFWLPMSKADAQAVVKKALEINMNFPKDLSDAIKNWLSGGELSLDQLDKVAGGAMLSPQVQQSSLRAADLYNQTLSGATPQFGNLNQLMRDKVGGGTVMCGW